MQILRTILDLPKERRVAMVVLSLAVLLSCVIAWQPAASAATDFCTDPDKVPAEQKKACEDYLIATQSKPNINTDKNCEQGQCLIDEYVQPGINLIASLVGVSCVISFILAGIRYATSADNPQKVSESKQRMVKTAAVLIGFFTFYALVNYLIPGGLVSL